VTRCTTTSGIAQLQYATLKTTRTSKKIRDSVNGAREPVFKRPSLKLKGARVSKAEDKADAERKRLDRVIVAVLKASREDLDLSRADLADRLGWKPEQIAELEIGRRIVRASDLILIARALKIEPDALVRRISRW
jgi:ribosome-binding protein aMBF1 (putative translation factor)